MNNCTYSIIIIEYLLTLKLLISNTSALVSSGYYPLVEIKEQNNEFFVESAKFVVAKLLGQLVATEFIRIFISRKTDD